MLLEESEEEKGEEVPFRPIDEVPSPRKAEREEVTMAEVERIQKEKKRKGKDVALPPKKKFRPAATTVRIKEPQTKGATTQPQTESEEEEEIRREQRSKQRQEAVAPTYPMVQVQINDYALGQRLKFDNEKWKDECAKRVTATKMLKSGKMLHQPSLNRLEAEEEFIQYITEIGFEWLIEMQMPKVPQAMAKEFYTSFQFKTSVTDPREESISFRRASSLG